MLTRLKIGKFTLSGTSVGGIYTSLYVAELGLLFDLGMAFRSHVGAKYVLLSHGHADHIGAYQTFLGLRGLARMSPPTTYLPEEFLADFAEGISALNRRKLAKMSFDFRGVLPGERHALHADLQFEAFRTEHSIPSLGYRVFREVQKLRSEFRSLPGAEIMRLKAEREDLFTQEERTEVVYATDTRIDIFDRNPKWADTELLILECTFLDEELSRREARERFHVHLDEIVEREALFQKSEAILLMHFSQFYSPTQVREILKRRLPPSLSGKVVPFCPPKGHWPG